MTRDHLTLFIDTNVFLHYPAIDQIAWSDWCDAKVVDLKLCMQVIHELDSKKDDATLSKRANRALADIKRARTNSGSVKDGVTLSVFPYEIKTDDFPDTLSADSKDDRIVHSVKKYVEASSDGNVAVCTEDFGMTLRCEAHGIAVVEPDRKKRLETPQSADQKEKAKLQAELNELKVKLPVLSVEVIPVAEDEQPLRRRTVRRIIRKPQQVNVDEAVEQERLDQQLSPLEKSTHLIGLDLALGGHSVARSEMYNQESREYIGKYRQYLEALNAFNASLGDVIRFRLKVLNSGRCPAEDVDILIRLPPIFTSVAADNKFIDDPDIEGPKAPKPPEKPLSAAEALHRSLGGRRFDDLSFLRSPMSDMHLREQPDMSLEGTVSDGVGIRLTIPRLLHHKDEVFGDLYAVFRAGADVKPFEAATEITAGNTPQKADGKLLFKFFSDDTDANA